MRKKWDRKGDIWKESNLDLFVLKSDHSRHNCDTALRRGQCSVRAKNTVAFGGNNKRRKAGNAWKHSKLQRISARLVWLSAVCRIQAKVSSRSGKQTSTREVKMAADGTLLMFCEPARSSCVVYPGPLLCLQYCDRLSSFATESRTVLDWWPPFFSTSISLVPLSGLSCTTVAFLQACCRSSWAQTFHSTLSVDFSWGKDQKESLRARGTRISSVGKAKDWLVGGEKTSWVFMFTACPFDVHTKTTWGPQQPVPVANMTVHLAATLHAWDCAPPLFPPCPMLCSTAIPSQSRLPTSQPSILHAKAHLAPPNQTLHYC